MRPWLGAMLIATTAAAEPVCKPPKAGDAVLVQIDQRVTATSVRSTATTRLFGTGAWTIQIVDRGGKPVRGFAGCIEAELVATIRRELAAAPWKLAREPDCHSDSPRYRVFTTAGAAHPVRHPVRACTVIDDATAQAIDDLEWIIPDLDFAGEANGSRVPRRCLQDPLAAGCS